MNSERKALSTNSGFLSSLATGGMLGGLTLAIGRLSVISDNRVIGAAQSVLVYLLFPA
jgi:hypothetical protein